MMKERWQELSNSGKVFVATIGVRLAFGLYLALNDHFNYRDTTSAVTVLAIYSLLGIFTLMFVYGKRSGLVLALSLSVVLILAHTVFTVIDLTGLTDAGLHGVANNPWPTVLRYLFFIATLGFGIRILGENREARQGSRP